MFLVMPSLKAEDAIMQPFPSPESPLSTPPSYSSVGIVPLPGYTSTKLWCCSVPTTHQHQASQQQLAAAAVTNPPNHHACGCHGCRSMTIISSIILGRVGLWHSGTHWITNCLATSQHFTLHYGNGHHRWYVTQAPLLELERAISAISALLPHYASPGLQFISVSLL